MSKIILEDDELYTNLKEKYDYTCWSCGDSKHYAKPSLFMLSFQANTGGGSCPVCGVSMILRIDQKNERMFSLEHTPENYKMDQLPESCYVTGKELKKIREGQTV
jgi:hypothetical protein